MRLQGLFRYPIKGLGREALDAVYLDAEAPMPLDRAWALLHKGAAQQTSDWQPRRNFLVVASGPRLAQIEASVSDQVHITLTHPDLDPLTLDPATDGDALRDWASQIWPEDRSAPTQLVRAPSIGMGDNGLPQVSVLNLASLDRLSDVLGVEMNIARFRGNLIVEDVPAWSEFDWVGKDITVGDVRLKVTERIERCRATEANPATGLRDANTLRALEDTWGHRDFGVYATVTYGGDVKVGDPIAIA